MKIFLAFIKKEFRHVWRDRRSLTILLGLPIMMMLLFGFAISNEVKDSKIAVLDYSNEDLSTTLLSDYSRVKAELDQLMIEWEKATEELIEYED